MKEKIKETMKPKKTERKVTKEKLGCYYSA